MFHFMFVHYTFSSVWVAEWPPFGKQLPARYPKVQDSSKMANKQLNSGSFHRASYNISYNTPTS